MDQLVLTLFALAVGACLVQLRKIEAKPIPVPQTARGKRGPAGHRF